MSAPHAAVAADGYLVRFHAMRGTVVAAGSVNEVDESSPVQVVGGARPGEDLTQPMVSTVASPQGIDTLAVTTRTKQRGSITAGRRMPGQPMTVRCDQRVAVATGPRVWASMASAWWLVHGYPLFAACPAARAIVHARGRQRPAGSAAAEAAVVPAATRPCRRAVQA